MTIDISDRARQWIRKRGSNLYVWAADMKAGTAFQRVATMTPGDREFVSYRTRDIVIWLDRGMRPPEELRIRRRPWPLGPIEVLGTGAGSTPYEGLGAGGV
jgi:hypothetical protein